MREPDDLDHAILQSWVARISRDHGGVNVSISSARLGPVCGLFIGADRPTLRFDLSDAFFDPYHKEATCNSASS